MAIEDYIPNIFGSAPTSYQGLLGAEETKALQGRANLSGLLSAGAALAQGMGSQGSRRSALQNILTAAAAGFGGSGQAYQQGLQNAMQQQQFALQQRQMAGVQAMKQKYPDLADEFDTNPAGAFRIVSEREAALRKPLVVGKSLVSPTGELIYKSEDEPKQQGRVLTSQESSSLGLPSGIVYQQTATGEIKAVEGTGAKAPELRDFADGTTRQFDPASGSWKVVARKPQGEGKSMYENKATVDGSGRLVFLPTRPGLPVVDATTGKPVSYAPAVPSKPLPAVLQKAEEEDFDAGQAAINLANDSQKYLKSITSGQIKFGLIDRARLATQSAFGSNDPDVVARNDFERFKTTLVNESLRLNKGTQTEGDAIRASKELQGAESEADAAKAIQTLRDINARRAKDYQQSIVRRRKNAKVGDPEVNLDVPQFEPYVFTDADYAAVPKGATYFDPKGQRRVKK